MSEWKDPSSGRTYEWEGDLTEMTPVSVVPAGGGEGITKSLGQLDSMSNGDLIERLGAAGYTVG